jgi:hypothetical protein
MQEGLVKMPHDPFFLVETQQDPGYTASEEKEMIREVQGARQVRGEGFRRWFTRLGVPALL